MPRLTLRCSNCKEDFPRAEILTYTPVGAKTEYKLCKKCYKERLENEKFKNEICSIFGCKAPGPIVYSQRKDIKNKYGYTDNVILNCLHYMYDVKGLKKSKPSLGLVTPSNVDEMKKYQRAGEASSAILDTLSNTQYTYECIKIKENNGQERKPTYNLDDLAY